MSRRRAGPCAPRVAPAPPSRRAREIARDGQVVHVRPELVVARPEDADAIRAIALRQGTVRS